MQTDFFKVLLLSSHLLILRHPVRKSKFGACAVPGYCSFKLVTYFTIEFSCFRHDRIKSVDGVRSNTKQKKALYLSVNVFSTKVLIEEIFKSPTGNGIVIIRSHPSQVKF